MVALAVSGCGGGAGEETSAWCSQFVSTATKLVAVYERVPEGVDPEEAFADDPELRADAEEAGREAERLRELEPPSEIADAYEIFSTQFPPPFVGTAANEEYEEAMAALDAFLRSDCGIDPDTGSPLANPQAG